MIALEISPMMRVILILMIALLSGLSFYLAHARRIRLFVIKFAKAAWKAGSFSFSRFLRPRARRWNGITFITLITGAVLLTLGTANLTVTTLTFAMLVGLGAFCTVFRSLRVYDRNLSPQIPTTAHDQQPASAHPRPTWTKTSLGPRGTMLQNLVYRWITIKPKIVILGGTAT